MKKLIYKIVLVLLCLGMTSTAMAQELSDKQIGLDVARITAYLKEHGVKDQDMVREITMMREMQQRQYAEMKKVEYGILQKIRADQTSKTSTNRVASTSKTAFVDIPQTEREALIALYNSTDGANWTNTKANNKVWDINNPNSDVSTWFGVTVNNGSVTNIQLYDNNLVGTISSKIGQLINLISLSLSVNKLNGSIPQEIGQLHSLIDLSLFNNQLNAIPSQIGQLENLETLTLSNNIFVELPQEIGQLKNLINLSLFNNQLSGEIPPQIGQLTKLEYLNLFNNQLSGIIPIEIGQLINLKYFSLTRNKLSGIIPAQIGQLINLERLYLSENQFIGLISVELGQLTNLIELGLGVNQLSGIIPLQILQLTNLRLLDLRVNKLSGIIPPQIGQLTNLQQLYLPYNLISGNIPSQLGQLTNLQGLILSDNKITGKIPNEISQLTKLVTIILDNNMLEGSIPDLTNLNLLYKFTFSSNKFRFVDFAKEFPIYKNRIVIFEYFSQSNTDDDKNITVEVGSSITLTMFEDGRFTPEDTYQWYKSQPGGGYVPINGATSRQYTISNFNSGNALTYYCSSKNPQITNPNKEVQNLILFRRLINLQVTSCPPVTGILNPSVASPTVNASTTFSLETDATGLTYAWRFYYLDGTTSGEVFTTATASRNYQDPGNYKVTLEVTDSNGCKTNFEKMVTVTHNCTIGQGKITLFPKKNEELLVVGYPGDFQFEYSGGLDTSYVWTFYNQDNTVKDTQTTPHGAQTYITPGNYKVTLTIKDYYGCPTTFEKIVNVVDTCVIPANEREQYYVLIDQDYDSMYYDSGKALVNTVTPISLVNGYGYPVEGFTYRWSLYNPSGNLIETSTQPLYTLTPTILGNYKIDLQITDNIGCTTNYTKTINVVDVCTFTADSREGRIVTSANYSGGVLEINADAMVNLNLYLYQDTGSTKTYLWKLYNPNEVLIASGTQAIFPITLTSGGFYKVTLEMTDTSNGCTTQYTRILNCLITNSCTLTNPKSALVQDLFVKLVKQLLSRAVVGDTDAQINGSAPAELAALKPYITTGIADVIYNFVSTRNQYGYVTNIQFSFSPDSVYDVKMAFRYGIYYNTYYTAADLDNAIQSVIYINFNQYIASDNFLISCYAYSGEGDKTTQKIVEPVQSDCDYRSDIRFVDFCPAVCATITGTIVVQTTYTAPVVVDIPAEVCQQIQISGGATGQQGRYMDCQGVVRDFTLAPGEILYTCQMGVFKEGYSILCSSIDPNPPLETSRTASKKIKTQ
jgi:Leucine-rich repeat (LRR) protein